MDSSSILCYDNNKDFKSTHVLLPRCNIIPNSCLQILDKLNMHPMDSYNGYFIVCEQPMGNDIMINIFRPGVLKQYYGLDKSMLCSDIVSCCTYGFRSERNNVCMEPNKFVTKLFDSNMRHISHYLKVLSCQTQKTLELDNVNLIHDFDSCTILSYFSHKDIKKA